MFRFMIAAGLALSALTAIPSAMAAPEGASVAKSYFAVVKSTGQLAPGRFTTGAKSKRLAVGKYQVTFPVALTRCAFIATVGSWNSTVEDGGSPKVASVPGNAKAVFVATGSQGTLADRSFHLVVHC